MKRERSVNGIVLVALWAHVLACGAHAGEPDTKKLRSAETRANPVPFDDVMPKPPPTRSEPVVDRYHGVDVIDPYRWMETPSAEFDEWVREQDAYARRVLGRIPGEARIRTKIREANRRMESVDVALVVGTPPVVFALRRGAADENAKLVVGSAASPGAAPAYRVLVDPSQRSTSTKHAAIDYIYPSPDGRFVAYVISMAGAEDGILEIVDVRTGMVLKERIDRVREPQVAWTSDSRAFFFVRQTDRRTASSKPGLRGRAVYFHRLGEGADSNDVVLEAGVSPLVEGDYSWIETHAGSPWAVAVVMHRASEWSFYLSRLSSLRSGRPNWRRVASPADKVFGITVWGDTAYAFTAAGAPNFRIVLFDSRSGAARGAKEFVPEGKRVLVDFAAGRDGLYLLAQEGASHSLSRVAWSTAVEHKVELPFLGSVRKLVGNPQREGVVFSLESWSRPRAWFQVSDGLAATPLFAAGDTYEEEDILAEDVRASSRDGQKVPLTIVYRKGLARDRSAPAILTGYGAYGLTSTPSYNPSVLSWVKGGGIYAICHVRGGGALGSNWHKDGVKDKKKNGIDDFIACATYLSVRRWTSSRRLTAFGVSAGGVVVGAALMKRPDLFVAGALIVPIVNLLRLEMTPIGPGNISEFGSVKVANEFKAMLAADPYHNVREGIVYPAILLTSGLNDPRVPVWQPAKLAARLQSMNSRRPTLLRVAADAGHGIGSTRTQEEDEYGDIFTFALWASGSSLE